MDARDARPVKELQQELIEQGLIEPVSTNIMVGYLSKIGESKGVLSNGRPVGVVCDKKVYDLEPNGTPSGLIGYLTDKSQ